MYCISVQMEYNNNPEWLSILDWSGWILFTSPLRECAAVSRTQSGRRCELLSRTRSQTIAWNGKTIGKVRRPTGTSRCDGWADAAAGSCPPAVRPRPSTCAISTAVCNNHIQCLSFGRLQFHYDNSFAIMRSNVYRALIDARLKQFPFYNLLVSLLYLLLIYI